MCVFFYFPFAKYSCHIFMLEGVLLSHYSLLRCIVEGSSSTPRTTTDDTIKLASGAQRVLLAVLPLLKGYFDSCGLFLHAFDAGNWPLCASIMELENCPVEVRRRVWYLYSCLYPLAR